MNRNGYKKNQYYGNCSPNNIDSQENSNSCHSKFSSPLHSLFEVENFLCNLKKASKCINLYKFLK